MISYIRGELAAVQEQKAIVEAGGIGYGIYMSQQTLSMLPAVGEEVKIHTYLNVREDAMQLYGIGKKTAEKLILELKDKMSIEDVLEQAAHGSEQSKEIEATDTGMQAEAVQALTALGYGSAESLRAVKKVSVDCASVEDLLREALKNLL